MKINIAIVGKPNVGKSTFFNKIFDSNISKVANQPGTTRTVIEKSLNYKSNEIIFYDTGGLKKKSKSNDKDQSYITKECLSAINKSSIVIFIMDASDFFTKNDKQIIRLILNKLKSVIVVINKFDLVKNEIKLKNKYFKFYFQNLFSDILIKPIFFSCLEKNNIDIILKEIIDLSIHSNKFIENKKLNFFLKIINDDYQVPYKGRFRPKIKFLTHVSSFPFILKAFGNNLKSINKNYKNFFLKKFLSYFNIYNKVVVIKFVNNENPYI